MKAKEARVKKPKSSTPELGSNLRKREKYFEIFIITVLFAFGVYHSILYFGHQVVPNTDFTGFVGLGHQLLSFQLPSSYKRAPVLGLLQAGLSYFVAGQHPDLTAGRLLNAILHPFNIVLLWLVGKRIVGRAALWIAIIAIINPWTIQLLTEPIVETTLLFFILLTFYFILKRSSWCYLFASITSMVRYEGAALILAAFVMDMITRKGAKEWLRAFLYSAAASVPLALWMLGTVAGWQTQGSTHYLKVFGAVSGGKIIFIEFIDRIWEMGLYPLFIPPPSVSKGGVEVLSKFLVAGSFVFGAIYALCKRRWDILTLLIFLLPYVLIHSFFLFVYHRFGMPIYWIVLLISLYGLQSGWKLLSRDNRVPKVIVILLQAVCLVLAFAWLVQLIPYLSKMASMSRRSVSMPYVAVGVVAMIFAARRFIYKARYCWRDATVAVLVCLMIVSNQFMLVRVVGHGRRDIEFKLLADWYIANAKPGEKMLSTLANVVRIFAPQHKDSLINTGAIKAESPPDFVRKCYDKNITYVAWDSRIGLHPAGPYYKLWGIKNIAMLARPKTIGPYEFVTQIRASERRFVNIFRLNKPTNKFGG